MVFGYVAEGKKKKQNIARRFLKAMKEGDFVTVSLAIGLDHQYLIEVNNPTGTGIFNITLEEKLKERCMKWGADHSIITTSGYIRIMNSYLVSIDGRLAFDTILLFCSGKFGVQSHNKFCYKFGSSFCAPTHPSNSNTLTNYLALRLSMVSMQNGGEEVSLILE